MKELCSRKCLQAASTLTLSFGEPAISAVLGCRLWVQAVVVLMHLACMLGVRMESAECIG